MNLKNTKRIIDSIKIKDSNELKIEYANPEASLEIVGIVEGDNVKITSTNYYHLIDSPYEFHGYDEDSGEALPEEGDTISLERFKSMQEEASNFEKEDAKNWWNDLDEDEKEEYLDGEDEDEEQIQDWYFESII